MKKSKLWMILAVVLVLALACAFAACDKNVTDDGGDGGGSGSEVVDDTPGGGGQDTPTPVDTDVAVPAGLKVRNGTAEWGLVDDATYELEINGTVVPVRRALRYKLLDYEQRPANGVFALRVRAIVNGKTGAWSDVVNYDHRGNGSRLLTPDVLGLEGTSLVWSEGVGQYQLLTVGTTEHRLGTTTTRYDLSEATAECAVTLTFVGDGVYDLDSATMRYRYDPSTNTLSFDKPQNVHMEGEVLCFDRVEGANVYYACDVNNTVTILKEDTYDRKGHFLVKSIWAGNTDLNIADSARSDVVYFVSSDGSQYIPQGTGTQADPFLIKTVGDMRYIEYCEAVGRSYHYKLANDIVFEAHTPGDREEYSNFYNLGSFSGVLDGDGHTLKNIVVYYKDGFNSIFENITSTGVIKNLVIADTAWRTWTVRTNDGNMQEKGGECAVLAYTNRGTIDNVRLASGNVIAARDGAAGLVSINRGTIRDCTVGADFVVNGVNEVGGIAIYNAGTIEGCVNQGTVSGTKSVGGIVGRNAGTVERSVNQGAVTGTTMVGGIVGYNYNIKVDDAMQYATTVRYCYNAADATVSGYTNVGGIAGTNGSTGVNELGLDAYANAAVYGCYNRGIIEGAFAVGGIAGENRAYYDEANHFGLYGCYSTGSVKLCRVVYYSNNQGWANVYAYSWNSETKESDGAWPGHACYYLGTNENGEGVYMAPVSANSDSIIFNDGADNKTADIALTPTSSGFYYAAADSVGTYVYNPQNITFANPVSYEIGYLAGINNIVCRCYYVAVADEGRTYRAIGIGNLPDDNVSAINAETDKTTICNNLNTWAGAGTFVLPEGNGMPVLSWQQ